MSAIGVGVMASVGVGVDNGDSVGCGKIGDGLRGGGVGDGIGGAVDGGGGGDVGNDVGRSEKLVSNRRDQ